MSPRAAAALATLGGRRLLWMLISPVVGGIWFLWKRIGVGLFGAWVGGTHCDPFHEVVDNGVGQLAARRHFVGFIFQRGDEWAVVRLGGDDHRPGFAAGPHAIGGV